jgi:hypothetical protein
VAGYSGRTREAYTSICGASTAGATSTASDCSRSPGPRSSCPPGSCRNWPSTCHHRRRLSTLAGFYHYATEEGVIEHSPALHVRRPRLDYKSHAVGLDCNELGAFLVAAGLSSPRDPPCARSWL